jgi:hypothetical protein
LTAQLHQRVVVYQTPPNLYGNYHNVEPVCPSS